MALMDLTSRHDSPFYEYIVPRPLRGTLTRIAELVHEAIR